MTAREYLTQARMIDSRINSKLMELQRARELATKATGLVSDMPRNPSPDLQQMESRVVKIVDLEREINAEIDELVDLKRVGGNSHFLTGHSLYGIAAGKNVLHGDNLPSYSGAWLLRVSRDAPRQCRSIGAFRPDTHPALVRRVSLRPPRPARGIPA